MVQTYGRSPTEILEHIDRGLRELKDANGEDAAIDLLDLESISDNSGSEFLIMLKPEILEPGRQSAIQIVLQTLEESKLRVLRARLFTGYHARVHRLMHWCYLPLYRHAGCSADELPTLARMRLQQYMSESGVVDGTAYTAATFLKLFRHWSAEALAVLHENLPIKKVGAGLYAVNFRSPDGRRTVLLNAFQPEHESHLTRSSARLLALHCSTDGELENVRRHVVGNISPRDGSAGSIRHRLWAARARLGFEPTIAFNGVHVSPGLLEAAFHLPVMFGGAPADSPLAESALYRRAVAENVSTQLASMLKLSLASDSDRLIAIFEATEGATFATVVSRLVDRV